jgi:hypothetical protein
MAVTHLAATRNGLADNVVDQLNNGFLKYVTSGDVEVATCGFGATAFGAAASGIATANAISDDTSATGGTVAKAELQTSAPTSIVFCSVTATGGGGDIEISSTAIGAGETVSTTSLTYEAAP